MRSQRSKRARIAISMLTVFAVVAVFIVRLVDIQLVQADELNAQSYDKRAQELITFGLRGDIVDRNGVVLAGSVDRYDVVASPRVALGPSVKEESAVEDVSKIAQITDQDPAALIATFAADPESDFEYLAQGVTLEQYRAIKALDIAWVDYQYRPSRSYPNGAIAGNLTGWVGTDGPAAGLEYSADECLGSTNGSAIYEKGGDGIRIPGSLVTEKKAEDGGTLRLTIDRDLQWFVQNRLAQTYTELGATWVTAVVIRVSDGQLMAVADYPSVDPNNVDGVAITDLGSKAFSVPYEVGSIMKPLTIASVVDAGVADTSTQLIAPGRRYLPGGGYIKDAWAHDDMRLTTAGVLMNSSNTGISVLSDLLPAEKRRDYMLAFGLNQRTEVHFDSEAEGTILPTSDWDEVTNYAVQFGQAMTATTVQMASVYQTIGNGGVRMPVSLIAGCQLPDGTITDAPPTEGTRVISEYAASATLNMMETVVTDGGARNQLQIPGYRVAAKSGTAEVAENGQYVDKSVLSFAGMAPAENPEYAVVVSAGIPSTMYSSGAVATSFRDIMAHVLKTYRVSPSTEPAPHIPLTW